MILLPIRGETAARGIPWITGLLVAANVGVFAWQLRQGSPSVVAELGFVPARFATASREGASFDPNASLVPGAVASSGPLAPGASLVTSMFVHGNWLHLISNLVYLWVFGIGVEGTMGGVRYLLFYLATGLGGHLAQFLTNPHSVVPTIGASGAISGILAAYLLRFPHARVKSLLFLFVFLRWVRVPAFLLIGYWLLIQVLNGAAELGGVTSGGVAWFEHLGGFFAGFVLFPAMAAGRAER
ncbi:MAG: rhomboid family intramembrane serine protease [bacterium]